MCCGVMPLLLIIYIYVYVTHIYIYIVLVYLITSVGFSCHVGIHSYAHRDMADAFVTDLLLYFYMVY